jgi:hypothetical protein
MSDIAHTIGSDLTVSATGDIALSSGTQLGQERILRRLLTNPKAYIWHLNYGAGLGRFVGQTANAIRIAAVAKAQMFLEAVVARTPSPAINVNVQQTGVVTLNISYVDAPSQTPQNLDTFNLNG